MTPELEREAARICEAALDLPAAEWPSFVARECGVDETLRRAVESLLRQQSDTDHFLQRPALDVAAEHLVEQQALLAGQQVGPYLIQGLLGVGGMGEVYRAHDTKLGRDVAIKVLPRVFTSDPARMARFTREARLLAAFNHPNVGAIYGLEDVDGITALVLELVEGETLADRLATGPLPTPDAMKVASQIVAALEAAHDKGIVHRDLKPANIAVTPAGVVKVLDFGLAQGAIGTTGPGLARPPGLSIDRTRHGAILGSAAYMSPEQARGEAVDKRTDIWAFGCVLYETLVGRAAFSATSITETLSEVLKTEPDWQGLPPETPDSIRRLLRRCLTKDRTRRLADVHDAQLDLDEAPLARSTDALLSSRAHRHRRFAWAMMVLLATVVAIGAGILWRTRFRTHSSPPQVRFDIATSPTSYPDTLAISPDGKKIVYAGLLKDGQSGLWVHSLDTASAQPLAGTAGGRRACWSPDSRSLAFFANSGLRAMDLETGTVLPLVSVPEAQPCSWSRDGTILYSPFAGPVLRTSDRGGEPVAVEFPMGGAHTYPRFLPDGLHFLYAAYDEGSAPRGVQNIYVGQLNGADHRRLVNGSSAEFASSGYLLYIQSRNLLAQPFDPTRRQVSGGAVQIAEQVIAMSVAGDGTLAFRSGTAVGREMAWFNRAGKEISRPPDTGGGQPALSPDERRVAVSRGAPGGGPRADVWIFDPANNQFSTVTTGPGSNNSPVWSPDGGRIVFASARNGKPFALYERAASGGGGERLLLQTREHTIPNDWSPDGRFLIYRSGPSGTNSDLWVLSIKDNTTSRLVQTEFSEREAQFSPDGRWFAYQSNESGRFEIYIRPFPDAGRTRIGPLSSNGGVQVRWRRDGRELFYVALDNTLMAVPVQASPAGDAIEAGLPVSLFRTNVGAGEGMGTEDYAVSRNGETFLVNNLKEVRLPITVILNWKPKP